METSNSSSIWLKSPDDPTLSLSMIVKNEIETLERCLRTARPHVDEIVVVDTGSTDGTREVAKRYADTFDEIEWPGSFSQARNHSYDLATGGYILVLDGDEYIPNPFHWEMIRKGIAQPNIVLLQLRLRNLLPEDGLVQSSSIWHERVVLNHPEIRWEGKVHNQIQGSVQRHARRTGMKMGRVPAEIIHVGYALSENKKQEKYSVRIPLLRDEYETPRSAISRAYYGFQLALVYLITRETEKALDILMHLDYELMNDENGFYAHFLATRAAMILDKLDCALRHCEAMFRITRSEPVSYFALAFILLRKGKIYEGMLTLIEAFQVNVREMENARFTLNETTLLNTIQDLCKQANFSERAFSVLDTYVRNEGENEATNKLLRVLEEASATKDETVTP